MPGGVLTLRSRRDFQGLGDSVLDFRGTVMPIRRATIIIHTGTISARTTLIPSHIRIITVATGTAGITGVGLITATIAIIITTTIELM